MFQMPFAFFILLWFNILHPFFVSMTEIVYRPKEKQLEVSVRIFTDDLEKALAKECGCKVDLSDPVKHAQMEPILNQYLTKVLKIKVNGTPIKPIWLGFEKEEESIWSYLEVKSIGGVQTLDVENRILHQTQPKQTNLVRFQKEGKDQTRQLMFPESQISF